MTLFTCPKIVPEGRNVIPHGPGQMVAGNIETDRRRSHVAQNLSLKHEVNHLIPILQEQIVKGNGESLAHRYNQRDPNA